MSQDNNLTPLSDIASFTPIGEKQRRSAPPAAKPDLKRSIVNEAPEVLEDVYEFLGGVQGSQMYWQNHEEEFRSEIEAKILVKKATRDVDVQEAAAAGKNIFMTFIQNNGLAAQPQNNSVEEATVVEDKEEEK